MNAIDWLEIAKTYVKCDPPFATQCINVAIKKLQAQEELTKQEEAHEAATRG